jgi:SAM-dependent methyltransferase
VVNVQDETLVSAADIARLADVGRSAVSNWRRRYAGFPQPAGGTPVAPLFALAEVEAWLRGQGKLLEVPLAERAWQELRAQAGDDLHLGAALADAGEQMAHGRKVRPAAVAELVTVLGAADAFEVLLSRLQETQARGATATLADLAELMTALAGGVLAAGLGGCTVLDPACGTGELLLAARDAGAGRLLGQDADAENARLAAVRLMPGPGEATIRPRDALERDEFPGVLADVVLCVPPVHRRSWESEPLAADPRWVFGVPPRLEPELAWAQHMIAHLSPGGLAVAVVPAATAARRPGRRIRAQLLRKGALCAVVALPTAHHVWVLRRPPGDTPGSVLMAVAAEPRAVIAAWRRFAADPAHDDPGVSRAVPVIDLLDDEVDLTPARHLSARMPERTAERLTQATARLAGIIGALGELAPDLGQDLAPAGPPRELTSVAVSELARLGHLEVRQAPARGQEPSAAGAGAHPLLTAEDVSEDRPASGLGQLDERRTTVLAGDVVVTTAGGQVTVRVIGTAGPILGPALTLVRVDPDRLDPHFVAGVLRRSANTQGSVIQTGGTTRTEIWRAQLPVLPLAEQRAYGAAFRRMDEVEAATRAAAAVSAELAQLLADGITTGMLEPPRKR